MAKESLTEARLRWRKLERLQEHYMDFDTLLVDVINNFMGFDCSDIQKDIGKFLSEGPSRAMVQAQRGQAKTTITAIYAVWCMIHDPSLRVLIVSAGGPMAKQISNWIIQIIMGMDEFACLRPDTSNGDRSSVEAFDIHHSLKGPEKSPSIACLGVSSNIQGYRADLLIADDIESKKNSKTAVTREALKDLTKDFTSICSKGKILYLGTPQSVDSVYNSLPSRGYTIRVWPGRYPTEEEEKNYGDCLAPLIRNRMERNPSLRVGGGPDGTRGQAVDPVILPEAELTFKEIDQGPAYFQLQHMLDTKLMDKERYPLKPDQLVFMDVPKENTPVRFNFLKAPEYKLHIPQGYPIELTMYEASGFNSESPWLPYTGTHIYIDPSGTGKNGDELAWAVTKFLSGNIYLVDVGGIPGGLHEANQQAIVDLVLKWRPQQIDFEDNFGAGTFRQILEPRILSALKAVGAQGCGIEGVWESGQKELRIIDILEPIISSNRLVVDKGLIARDWEQCQRYAVADRGVYSFFFQLARLTRDKKALAHDDRLDAVAGSCRYWNELLSIDAKKQESKIKQDQYKKLMSDPLGNGRGVSKPYSNVQSMFDTLRG